PLAIWDASLESAVESLRQFARSCVLLLPAKEPTPPSTSSTNSTSAVMDGALLEIGRIVKPHGLRGEVVVELVTNRLERLAGGSQLLIATEQPRDQRELVVTSSRPHQGRHLVIFEGVSSRESAELLRNVVLYASSLDDADALFVHELIGKEVFDAQGE